MALPSPPKALRIDGCGLGLPHKPVSSQLLIGSHSSSWKPFGLWLRLLEPFCLGRHSLAAVSAAAAFQARTLHCILWNDSLWALAGAKAHSRTAVALACMGLTHREQPQSLSDLPLPPCLQHVVAGGKAILYAKLPAGLPESCGLVEVLHNGWSSMPQPVFTER